MERFGKTAARARNRPWTAEPLPASLQSHHGNATIPSREHSIPRLGILPSPTGNTLFPIWEKTRTRAGNELFPGREEFPNRERSGQNTLPFRPGADTRSCSHAGIRARPKDRSIRRACDLEANLAHCLFHVKQNKNKICGEAKLSGNAPQGPSVRRSRGSAGLPRQLLPALIAPEPALLVDRLPVTFATSMAPEPTVESVAS